MRLTGRTCLVSQEALEHGFHPFVMGSLPVNLVTGAADGKFLVIFFRQRLKTFEDRFLADRLEEPIAAQTATERRDQSGQSKAPYDLVELFLRLERAQAISEPDDFPHQQATIAAQ